MADTDSQRAHALVVVGASAGGVEGLRTLVAALPPDLRACVLVVLHVSPDYRSVLPSILDRAGPLHAAAATDGQPLVAGTVAVAPPGFDLAVEDGRLHLDGGPHERGPRPSIDVLFRTAAEHYGPRCLAILLSGALDDGTIGMRVVKAHGGIAIVQDPAEAHTPSMPASAIHHAVIDHVVPVADMPALVVRLLQTMPDALPLIQTAEIPATEGL